MDVSALEWSITVGVTVAVLLFDVLIVARRPHEPTMRECSAYLAVYVGAAIAFGAWTWGFHGQDYGIEFYTGWLVEYSLSVDNLFVFIVLMAALNVPRKYQQEALMVGIILALVFRAIFIAVGYTLVENFSWVFYVFGAFLVYTAVNLVRSYRSHEEEHPEDNRLVRFAQSHLNVGQEYRGLTLWWKENGVRVVSPMLIVILALTIKGFGPPVTGFTWRQRFQSLPPALPIVAVVLIIIGFVYNPFGGDAWGTPTEGGAIGAFIVFLMAVFRGMRWPELKDALLETAKLSVMIFSIIWGVLIYVRFLGFADLPSAFSDWITSLDYSPMLILICILLAYAVLGMFMDAIGMLLLTLPVVYPAVMALNGGEFVSAADSAFGMNGTMCAIWFGILVVKMAEFCLITPPIGLNCFVVAGVRDDVSVQDVFRGVMPFFLADGVTIALLVAFPWIVLWLPSLAS